MSTFAEIKAAIDRQGEAFEEFKKVNDQRLDAVKNGNESKAKELDEKLGRIEQDVAKFSELKRTLELEQQLHKERIEELEARAASPGKTAQQKRQDEYKSAFVEWVRSRGQAPQAEAKMHELQRKAMEQKDVTIGTGAAGGFAVPEEIAREIGRLELLFSPVRSLVKVVTAGSSDYKELVSIRGTTSGWVGETTTRTATATSQLRERTPTHGELYAYPQASEWSLDDVFFNVEDWIAEEVAQEFAVQEGDAVIRGNASNKPTGMINTAPAVTADFASPPRSAEAYEAVESDLTPGAQGIVADNLIDLVYRLNSAYRMRGVFVFNSLTTAAIRKLQDDNGQYLWAPGLQAGQPDRLLGYPTATWEQMDDIGSNKYPVAFGDFRRGYVLADRVGIRITRDNVTNIGFVKFYVRRREGGIVLDNHAIKFLKTI